MIPQIAAGLFLVGAVYQWYRSRPLASTFSGPSTDLKRTEVVPHLNCPLPDNRSALWCITLELAWKKAMADLFGGPIQPAEPNQLFDWLNDSSATWDGLPAELLSLGVTKKSEQEYLVKGSMNVCVPFSLPFFDNERTITFSGDGLERSVKCFGIRQSDRHQCKSLRQQVSVLYESSKTGEFIIDPCIHTQPFRLVLAKVGPQASLGETIEHARSLISGNETRPLDNGEILLIPSQSWDIQHRFPQLAGALGGTHPGGRLNLEQGLRFQFNRRGVKLHSNILAAFYKSGISGFIFDSAFLIYVEARQTGQLIFAAWMENSELMVKA